MKRRLSALLLAALSGLARADEPQSKGPPSGLSPEQVVAEFHKALDADYARGAIELLAPDVLIYEQGYSERTREGYANGHLGDDLTFASSTRRTVVKTESWVSGELAGVVTEFQVDGNFKDSHLALDNTETMLLRKDAGEWRISHIHWSAHPREEAPPAAAPPAP
jgi:ketosteroid isomerase-like protein